jgi:hypothetical protein
MIVSIDFLRMPQNGFACAKNIPEAAFCISWQNILKSDSNPSDSEKSWIVIASTAGNHLF